MRNLLLPLCLILNTIASTAQTGNQPERCLVENCLIKDGVGIESIVVGQSVLSDTVARFGDDYKLIEHRQYSYEARYEKLGLSFYYRYGDEQKKIFEIEVRPPFRGVTENGLLLGKSTLEEVEKKYWPIKFSMTVDSETHWFDYPGIEFHVAADKALRKASRRQGAYLKRRVSQINVDVIDPPPLPDLMEATPVEVSDGALLFFNAYGDVAGKRRARHYVVDPEISQTPRPFLVGDDDYKPWHRFNQDEFLMGSNFIPSDLFFLNIKTGATQQLLEGGLIDLFKVDGDRVFFVEQEHSDRGFAPNAEKIKAKRAQSSHTRHRLYVFDRASLSPSRLVADEALLHVLAIDEKYCWVITDRLRPELWRITKDGKEQRKIAGVKDDWIHGLEDATASPDGSLLALGVNDSNKMWLRTLVVIDVATGKIAFKSSGINVMESGERKSYPDLKFAWLDNGRIRFSETETTSEGNFFRWVDLDIRTGKRLNKKRYSKIDYEHLLPSKDSLEYTEQSSPRTRGLFVLEFPHLLYFEGDAVPVGDLREDQYNTDIDISVEGKWAVFAGPKTGAYLADGVRKTKTKFDIKGSDFTWMPSIGGVR